MYVINHHKTVVYKKRVYGETDQLLWDKKKGMRVPYKQFTNERIKMLCKLLCQLFKCGRELNFYLRIFWACCWAGTSGYKVTRYSDELLDEGGQ